MRIAVAILLVFFSGCCAEQVSITDDWTRYLVLAPNDGAAMRERASSSYIVSICREYIDMCWEWNVDLSLSLRNKPVVICKVPDDVELHSRNVKINDLQTDPIPCGGIMEIKEISVRDAIVKVCDNYGLTCSFGYNSITISVDN